MLEKKEKFEILNPTENLDDIVQVLSTDDSVWVKEHQDYLMQNWKKKQVYRTEAEMRLGVLNDSKFPTQASKYWQAVREMDAHFEALVSDSFAIRREGVRKLELESKLNKAIEREDEFKVMKLRIDLEETLFNLASMKQSAADRVRELKLWTRIQQELEDGSFDSQNVENHQKVSLVEYWKNRANALTEHSDHGDIANVTGAISSINNLSDGEGNLLDFRTFKNNLLSSKNEEVKKKYLAANNSDTIQENSSSNKKVLDFRSQ